jgi:glucose-6-phosphate 1-dehydrogenase
MNAGKAALRRSAPQAIVIFGASGDLTRRKLLPAFFHLYLEGLLPEKFAIVGYARTEFTDEAFREHAREAIGQFGKRSPDGQVWMDFARHLSYVTGEFSDAGAMNHVTEDLADIDAEHGTEGNRFFYCATPPAAYPDIVKRIGEAGLQKGAKIVFEKPFGRDLESARELNTCIHGVFDESQVFRIDHYLGKETVQNILAFRFANGLFEPIWNRRYIDHVQITAAESIGIEGRGALYEQTGAIRDLISTHLFQMMTFLAMEPPVSFEPNRLRDETVKVLRSAQLCDARHLVRGQYEGYRSEPGVSDSSNVETFAALQIDIDNWRWADVPFYLRTGKGMAAKSTEITLKFRKVPFNVFRGSDMDLPQRDHLTIRIQPDEGITLALNAKKPGPGIELGRVTMDFDYDHEFPSPLIDAYELLLLGAMEGDHTLFLRQDGVERAWELLEPVLDVPGEVVRYPRGGWGPVEADALIAPRKWHRSLQD